MLTINSARFPPTATHMVNVRKNKMMRILRGGGRKGGREGVKDRRGRKGGKEGRREGEM